MALVQPGASLGRGLGWPDGQQTAGLGDGLPRPRYHVPGEEDGGQRDANERVDVDRIVRDQ